MTAGSLFGAPIKLTDAQRAWWVRTLTVGWRALMDREPGDLRADLVDLAPLYGSGARPKAIRERLHRLPAVDSDAAELPREIALILDGSSMITPEGRIYLAVLHKVSRSAEIIITEELQLWALGVAASTRGEWYAQWVRKQFEGSLSASALGAAIFLLVNGSIGESRALVLPSDPIEDRRLGATIIPLISRFSVALGGKEPEANSGIRQHWAFTQVSRLLGRDVAREKSPVGTSTYVRPGREESLLAELSDRLNRLSSPGRRHDAVEQLVSDYRTSRGALASAGLMHEDPTATRRIVERLTWPGIDL